MVIYSISAPGKRPNVLLSPETHPKAEKRGNVKFESVVAAATPTTRVTIMAPTGRLGIIVKSSPETGLSYVSRIKEDCPIKDELQVGDQILEVDGEDVSNLRVIHIASKSMMWFYHCCAFDNWQIIDSHVMGFTSFVVFQC